MAFYSKLNPLSKFSTLSVVDNLAMIAWRGLKKGSCPMYKLQVVVLDNWQWIICNIVMDNSKTFLPNAGYRTTKKLILTTLTATQSKKLISEILPAVSYPKTSIYNSANSSW